MSLIRFILGREVYFCYFASYSSCEKAVKTILFGVFVINHVSECFQWGIIDASQQTF